MQRDRNDPAAMRLLELVSRSSGVPVRQLIHRSRCSAEIAEARQLAMYLMHVQLQRTYETVARTFGRERTTVSYACARVEDRREDRAYDATVERLERLIGDGTSDEVALHAAG